MKARLRILLTLAYVLAFASHGLEHRLAASQAPDRDSCDTCAFLTFAGHAVGTPAATPVPHIDVVTVPVAALVAAVPGVSLPVCEGPHGARAPPRAA